MCGFIAQLVEQRTGNAEGTGSNPVEALIFSGSTKTWNPESGNVNGITETETERNKESNINDRKFKNFTSHNLVQSKKNLF